MIMLTHSHTHSLKHTHSMDYLLAHEIFLIKILSEAFWYNHKCGEWCWLIHETIGLNLKMSLFPVLIKLEILSGPYLSLDI